jgi:phosphoglycerate dehydrogenase-like enzyme
MTTAPVRIAINKLFAAEFAPHLERHLDRPHELVLIDTMDDAAFATEVPTLDAIVSGAFKAEWQVPATERPLLVHSVGAGLDGIDRTALPHGSTVCNVYGHERAVAERAFLHALALQQKLLTLEPALRQGDWTPGQIFLPEVSHKNLLVLGLGHIGRELVRWGRFLDMPTTVLTRTADPARAADLDLAHFGGLDQLAEQLPQADFVIVAVPDTPDTRDLIDADALRLMKSTAFLINVGRGPVINEAALYEALSERRIGGAGLDVWWNYPALGESACHPTNLPFRDLDNVIMTPHKATYETMAYRWDAIAANIHRHLTGQPLQNLCYQIEAG